MNKKISEAFGKKIYLLGRDIDGINYWLESASWDCGWYWGFGYIETYTNNRSPELARDINSHSHADKFMSEYFTSWNGSNPILRDRTFTDSEGWELSELFAQYYCLKESAEYFNWGKCNVANTSIKKNVNKRLVKKINEEMLPAIFNRVYEILTPVNERASHE